MKELELTGVDSSSKLNTTHLKTNGRFAMDEEGRELPLRDADSLTTRPTAREFTPETLRELLASGTPQAIREAQQAIARELAARGQLTPEQRSERIASGAIPLGGRQDIEIDPAWDEKLKNRIAGINAKLNDPLLLASRYNPIDDLKRLYDLEGVDPVQVKEASDRVREYLQLSENQEQAQARALAAEEYQHFRSFTLQEADMSAIRENPQKWLDDQFDILYDVARGNEVLDSPQADAIQNKFREAFGYVVDLRNRKPRDIKPVTDEIVNRFQQSFGDRFNLIFSRASVDRRSLEGIQGSVGRLGSSGMMRSLGMEDGKVGAMFNRISEALDDMRIRSGEIGVKRWAGKELQHLSPEMVNNIRRDIVKEQLELAKNGVGIFGDKFKEYYAENQGEATELVRKDIVRAVNSGWDIFGVSQRQAVIGSRGRQHDLSPYDFFTDPKSIFDMFNLEEFLTNKWGSLNEHQMHFLHEIKLDLARHASGRDITGMTEHELEELGTRLFKDLFVVPDFFSSGWRIKGTINKINELQYYYAQNEAIIEDLTASNPHYLIGDSPQALQIRGKAVQVEEYILQQIRQQGLQGDAIDEFRKKTYSEFASTGISIEGNEGKLVLSFEERMFFTTRFSPEVRVSLRKKAEERAKNLALFMRLKNPEQDDKGNNIEERNQVLKRIASYRPEEIMKILRSRYGMEGEFEHVEEINRVFEEAGIHEIKETGGMGEDVKIGAYDRFKKEYGPILAAIREKGLRSRPPQPVDFRNLSSSQKNEIEQALGSGAAEKVKRVYEGMDRYISGNGILEKFEKSPDYADIFNRVITTDDVIMDQLETPPENAGFQTNNLSGYWAAGERGGDALVRNYNDLAAAQQAGGSLVKFLKSHSKEEWRKNAEEFAHHVENYNGIEGAAKCFRFTYGSYLLTAKQFYGWDVLGIGELPWRQDSSKLEQIFGQGVDALTREQILEELDHVRGILTYTGPDAEKYYWELMTLAGTDAFSRIRDKGFQVFIYTMLILMLAPLAGATKAVGAASR